MTPCLTPILLTRYLTRRLESLDEFAAIQTHLTLCFTCREAVYRIAGITTAVQPAWIAAPLTEVSCPDNALLLHFASGRADAAEEEIAETHCEDCSHCAHALALYRAIGSVLCSERKTACIEVGVRSVRKV